MCIETAVEDVSMLGKAHSLNLASTAVQDVSALGGVFRLDLGSTRVADISALAGCSELYLKNCHCIAEYSGLHDQYKLDLSSVPITDAVVANLGKVKHITLAGCTAINDVSSLKDAFYVDLTNCTSVVSVAALANVRHLTITGCTGIQKGRK